MKAHALPSSCPHRCSWLWLRKSPRARWLTQVGPSGCLALQRHFPTPFPLHSWDNYFIPCLLKPSTPPPHSLLLAADRASYFSGKIEAIKKEFPQAPTTTASHLHASVLESPSSLLLLWVDHLCSERRPTRPTCARSHPPCSSAENSSPRAPLLYGFSLSFAGYFLPTWSRLLFLSS